MNRLHKVKVRGTTFEGYYYDENDNKIEVDGEFDIVGGEVMLVSVETNETHADLRSKLDISEIEETIFNKIDLDNYTSEYDHEQE